MMTNNCIFFNRAFRRALSNFSSLLLSFSDQAQGQNSSLLVSMAFLNISQTSILCSPMSTSPIIPNICATLYLNIYGQIFVLHLLQARLQDRLKIGEVTSCRQTVKTQWRRRKKLSNPFPYCQVVFFGPKHLKKVATLMFETCTGFGYFWTMSKCKLVCFVSLL